MCMVVPAPNHHVLYFPLTIVLSLIKPSPSHHGLLHLTNLHTYCCALVTLVTYEYKSSVFTGGLRNELAMVINITE